jgi:aryl-alcohol dehydrogenase-like predicted oxidoreductase
MGCWQIGGPISIQGNPLGWQSIKETDVEVIVNSCYEIGIRTFDTSNVYGNGLSELLLGKYLSSYSDVQIITKFGNNLNGNKIPDFSVNNLLTSLDGSLNRLNRSTIDTLLFHGFTDSKSQFEGAIQMLEDLKSEGVLKHWGFSVNRKEHALFCLENKLGDSIELIYNILERRIEPFLPNFVKHDFRVIARSPFANGLIHPRMLAATLPDFHKDDIRKSYSNEVLNWFSKQLKENSHLKNPEELLLIALRYLMHHDVYKIVPGIRSLAHVELVKLAYQAGPLSTVEKNNIRQSLPDFYPKWK